VTRMHRIRPGLPAGGDDFRNGKVTFNRWRRSDRERLVCHRNVEGAAVRFRVDRYGGNPEPARRPDDPAGDLATTGDQNAMKHAAGCLEQGRWLCGAVTEMSTE